MRPPSNAKLNLVFGFHNLCALRFPQPRRVHRNFKQRKVNPTHNRQFLERRIAYKLQEIEFRKVGRVCSCPS